MKNHYSINISQFHVVIHLCGFLMMLNSFSMLPPMLVALFNKERSFFIFLITFATFFSLGGGVWLATKTASTFGTLKDEAKYLMCAAMILGRLEIYPVLILFSRFFWRN